MTTTIRAAALALLGWASVSVSAAQTHVSFVHGFNDSPYGAWSEFEPVLENEYAITTTLPGWSANSRLTNVASSLSSYSNVRRNSIAVAHSTGGVISREIQRLSGDSYLSGLITIGTPHRGAPVADLGQNAGALFSYWAIDLISPWYSYGVPAGLQTWANSVIAAVLGNQVDRYVDPLLSKPAVQDLGPNSAFIQRLNQSPNATLPDATRTFAIYGHEDYYTYARFGDSTYRNFQTGNRLESGAGVQLMYEILGTYSWIAYSAEQTARSYEWRYFNTGDFNYYARAQYWYNVAFSFLASTFHINRVWQMEYSHALLGNNYFGNAPAEDDGFIPVGSQQPSFISSANRLIVRGDNHLEETQSTRTLDRIRQAFGQLGVPRRGGGTGPGDPPDDPPFDLPECEDNGGEPTQIICEEV